MYLLALEKFLIGQRLYMYWDKNVPIEAVLSIRFEVHVGGYLGTAPARLIIMRSPGEFLSGEFLKVKGHLTPFCASAAVCLIQRNNFQS